MEQCEMMNRVDCVEQRCLMNAEKDKDWLTIITTNGYQMKGRIVDWDANVIVIETDCGSRMLYKHAISTIAPVWWEDDA